jgi:hypothetical protein
MPGKNLDCLNVDLFSVFGVFEPSLPILVLLPRPLILKKFRSFEGKWLGLESLGALEECFLVDKDRPEKFRFSEAIVDGFDDDEKICVICVCGYADLLRCGRSAMKMNACRPAEICSTA